MSHVPVPALNILSVPLDAITIGTYYGSAGGTSCSTFMSIVNLLLRPVTSLVLLRFYNDRVGNYSGVRLPGFGTSAFGERSMYEDLERNRPAPQQSVPSHHSASPDVQIGK